MEKQTKILLGVGAVIAAYLILKLKKTAAQTKEVNIKNEPDWDSLKSVGDNKPYPDAYLGGRENIMVDKYGNEVIFIHPEGGQSYSVWNIKDKDGKIIKSIRYDVFGKEIPELTREQLGIPPDFIDNSEECKRNPYMCKM